MSRSRPRSVIAVALIATICAAPGCGPPPFAEWPTGEPHAFTLPLVDGWHPERLLVEVDIGTGGPVLFSVDTAVAGVRLVAPLAEALALPVASDPARGRLVRLPSLTVGDLTLTDVRCEVIGAGALGEFEERAIGGVLGAALFRESALRLDRRAGVLRLAHPRAESIPRPWAGARSVPLTQARGGWTLSARIDDETVDGLWLSTAAVLGALRPDIAERAELTPLPGRGDREPGWQANVALADGPPRPITFVRLAGAAPGVAGLLAFGVVAGEDLLLDARADTLWLGRPPTPNAHLPTESPTDTPAPSTAAPWHRFADLPDCGPGLRRCVSGRVTARGPGWIDLTFARPELPLPGAYWARVDFGVAPDAATVLVRLKPSTIAAPLTARVEVPDSAGLSLREPGERVSIVDVVPVRQRCAGQICHRAPRSVIHETRPPAGNHASKCGLVLPPPH